MHIIGYGMLLGIGFCLLAICILIALWLMAFICSFFLYRDALKDLEDYNAGLKHNQRYRNTWRDTWRKQDDAWNAR